MDSTTKNPRVVGIHLARIERHLAEALREAHRIDVAAFDPGIITSLRELIALAAKGTADVVNTPVIIPEKPVKAKAQKPAKELVVLAPTIVAAEVVAEPEALTADEDEDLSAPGAYDHLEAKFDNA